MRHQQHFFRPLIVWEMPTALLFDRFNNVYCFQTNSIFQHSVELRESIQVTIRESQLVQCSYWECCTTWRLKAKTSRFSNNSWVHINSLLDMRAQMQVKANESELKPVLLILWTGPSSIGKGHKSDPIRDYTLLKAYDSGRRESGAGRRGWCLQQSPQPAWNDSAWHTGPLLVPQTQPMKQV